ncbi:MAG: hypothetical protein FWG70_04700 [Oscillospiraceae bacterium]|nr:hypothetical protein [Oscillospiraceae bacterium]
MKRTVSLFLTATFLLTSCGKTPLESTEVTVPEQSGEITVLTPATTETTTKITTVTSPVITSPPEPAAKRPVKKPDTILYTDEQGPHYLSSWDLTMDYVFELDTSPFTYPAFMYGSFRGNIFYISNAFIEFVGRENFIDWVNDSKWKYEQSNDYYNDEFYGYPLFGWNNGVRPLIPTSLRDSCNLFSFIVDFDVPKEMLPILFEKTGDEIFERYGTRGHAGHENDFGFYDFTDEQNSALENRDEELLLKLFLSRETPFWRTIVKGKNYYSQAWFFFSSPEDYIEAGMSIEDLTSILESYRYNRAFDTGLKTVEQKVYEYLNLTGETFDNKEIFGYERDNNMPIPYEYLIHENFYIHHGHFFGLWRDETVVDIKKDDKNYNFSWVYYNTHDAYYEAGITYDELVEMLPDYKILNVLSEEAMTALENKIYSYEFANVHRFD